MDLHPYGIEPTPDFLTPMTPEAANELRRRDTAVWGGITPLVEVRSDDTMTLRTFDTAAQAAWLLH